MEEIGCEIMWCPNDPRDLGIDDDEHQSGTNWIFKNVLFFQATYNIKTVNSLDADSQILSSFVQLKSVVFKLLCLWIFRMPAANSVSEKKI